VETTIIVTGSTKSSISGYTISGESTLSGIPSAPGVTSVSSISGVPGISSAPGQSTVLGLFCFGVTTYLTQFHTLAANYNETAPKQKTKLCAQKFWAICYYSSIDQDKHANSLWIERDARYLSLRNFKCL
jgi:hypothetical protein